MDQEDLAALLNKLVELEKEPETASALIDLFVKSAEDAEAGSPAPSTAESVAE